MSDLEAIRKFGVEPDLENWIYDPNSCGTCGQPVLIVQSKERMRGARSEASPCEFCMTKLTKRTRAKVFKWIYLPEWVPD